MNAKWRWLGTFLGATLLVGCDDDTEQQCREDEGIACIWAGTGKAGFNGDELALRESRIYWPVDVAFNSHGTFVLDWNNHKVRKVTEDETFETVIGSDFVGDGDPLMGDLAQPGVPGTDVALNHPTSLIELADQSLMLIAWHNHKLRHFDPASGLTYVACGRGAGFEGDGMPAYTDTTRFNQPAAAVVAADGSVFLLDQRNQRIRKIGADGMLSTVVGIGMPGFAGDGGDPLMAQVAFPAGPNPQPNGTMALDASERLYFADTLNNRIRRVDFVANTIETIAGNGMPGFSGDGGPATAASIQNPRDMEIGPDGRLYFADEANHRVRAVDLESGVIETVVGNGKGALGEDGLPAKETSLERPAGIAFDSEGRLYVADTNNHVIRRVQLEGVAP